MTGPIADHEAPLTMLSLKERFFPMLTAEEQLYAHYMAKTSHAGTRVVLRQVSQESEAIYDLVLFIDSKLKGVYPGDSVAYLEYVSQFLSNLGNYKSFGDSKFVPGCPIEYVYQLCEACGIDLDKSVEQFAPFANAKSAIARDVIERGMFHCDDKDALLGFPADGHVSAYYQGLPVSLDDMRLLKEHLFAKYGILPENTRIKKTAADEFEVLVASANDVNRLPNDQYPHGIITLGDKAHTHVTFKFGDHSREMAMMAGFLEKAKEHAANDTQRSMLDAYIRHFSTGSGVAHKDSQRLWVKDIAPVVETNIGFIETYREPSGIIGEFEGLVAIQNKDRTAKFETLVNTAEEFISLLPWDAEFEKDKFNPPDFTSIEVLAFAGSGIPAGINIPNYDDVRLSVGFKNVSLGNILSAAAAGGKDSTAKPPSFIKEEDLAVFKKYQAESFEVQVGIHELLGHGSGKLLMETADGEYNFDIANPPLGLDGKPVTTFYKRGETWGSVFGSLAGAFEETRAEVVAMFLITNRKLLEIFGFKTQQEQDDVIYAGYLQMARAGLMALEFWDPATGKWGQPHMQARFSIMKTFLKHCSDANFLTIDAINGGSDLRISLDRSLIETAGKECVRDYLLHLHVYKCSADVIGGSAYYTDRSTVPAELAALRDTVIAKRLARRQFIQGNTVVTGNAADPVELREYPETVQGMIASFAERET